MASTVIFQGLSIPSKKWCLEHLGERIRFSFSKDWSPQEWLTRFKASANGEIRRKHANDIATMHTKKKVEMVGSVQDVHVMF